MDTTLAATTLMLSDRWKASPRGTLNIYDNPEKGFDVGHHNPRFGFDEDALEIALQLCIDVVKNRERLAKA